MEEEKSREEIIEEKINRKALKIGRKILDEVYAHGIENIGVNIRKSKSLDWLSIVSVGVHQITGLVEDEIRFISNANITEKCLDYFEIRRKD